jgi:SAM-dependent methyltransferase
MLKNIVCSICSGDSIPLDVVDFNKSCEEEKGKFFRLSGVPVYYYLCTNCGFCFAPEFSRWSLSDFSKYIYNEHYIEVDPDYHEDRPKANAAGIINMFNGQKEFIRHLDFGGGNGLLSQLLQVLGWNSRSYDPFNNLTEEINKVGDYNLITAYEVFEHVPDVNNLISQLSLLLNSDGIILFTTLLSDGNLFRNHRLDWWYASPRNGHISLYSKDSLNKLSIKYGFKFESFSSVSHVLYKETLPIWATHLFETV